MPSDTPTVLYCHASILSFTICFLISLPRSNTVAQLMYCPHADCGSGNARRWRTNDKGSQNPEVVTYSACCSLISIMTTISWGEQNILAWITFPPHTRDTYVWLCLHCFPGRHTCCVQHSLTIAPHVSYSGSTRSWAPGIANLSTWKIVTRGESRRVFVQRGLAILEFSIVSEMWEVEKAWLLWLALRFEISGIHCGRNCVVLVRWGKVF